MVVDGAFLSRSEGWKQAAVCRVGSFFLCSTWAAPKFFPATSASDIVGSIYFTLPQATMPQPAWIQGRLGTEGPGPLLYNTVLSGRALT